MTSPGEARAFVVALLGLCGVLAAYVAGPTPLGQATLWTVIVIMVAHYETRGEQ